jgi:hypothetical protein
MHVREASPEGYLGCEQGLAAHCGNGCGPSARTKTVGVGWRAEMGQAGLSQMWQNLIGLAPGRRKRRGIERLMGRRAKILPVSMETFAEIANECLVASRRGSAHGLLPSRSRLVRRKQGARGLGRMS